MCSCRSVRFRALFWANPIQSSCSLPSSSTSPARPSTQSRLSLQQQGAPTCRWMVQCSRGVLLLFTCLCCAAHLYGAPVWCCRHLLASDLNGILTASPPQYKTIRRSPVGRGTGGAVILAKIAPRSCVRIEVGERVVLETSFDTCSMTSYGPFFSPPTPGIPLYSHLVPLQEDPWNDMAIKE
jgi:hypothetical protein